MNVEYHVVSAVSVLVADILVVDLAKVADPGELVIVNKSIGAFRRSCSKYIESLKETESP